MIRLRHILTMTELVRDFWIGFAELLAAEEQRRTTEKVLARRLR